MYYYYNEIDEAMLIDIQKYEELQLSKLKNEFDDLCAGVSKIYGWNYTIEIHRWVDKVDKRRDKYLDGYTATLQIDFVDCNGNVIELDESICSFFENITYIAFISMRHKYRVFQNDKLGNIRAEVRRFICKLKELC